MKENLISVIVPVYNVQEYLCECIESIQNQTYDFIELILVNDGSTDHCTEICDRYAGNDSRIVVIHQNNHGVSSARNTGIKRASGDYIGFVDGDDKISPLMYEEMLQRILTDHTQMCVSTKHRYNDLIWDNSMIQEKLITNKEAIFNLLQMNFPTSLGSGLYESNLLKGICLNEQVHYWEDFEFQLRILDKAKLISLCDFPFYYYRQRAESANHQQINKKVLSCLKIPSLVHKLIMEKYPEFQRESQNLYVAFLQIVISYLSKSPLVHKEYYKIITKYSRKYFWRAMGSNNIKFLMKVYISLCVIDAKIFWILYRFLKGGSV